jgi:ATP-binding cassette, subfamily B, multidrug efflux pump
MLIRLVREGLRQRRLAVLLILALQLGSAAGMLYLPTLNASIIDNGVLAGNQRYILGTGAVMVAVALANAAALATVTWLGARIATALGRDLRAAVFARVLEFSSREMARFGAPSLIIRTTNDVQQVQMVTLLALTTMLTAPVTCVGGAALAVQQSVPLSAVPLVSLPLLGAVFGVMIRRVRPLMRRSQYLLDRVTAVLREQITGVRVVRAFVADGRERVRFTSVNERLLGLSVAAGKVMASMFPAAMLVANLAAVAVAWFGGRLAASGAIQVGALTAFLGYLALILGSTMLAIFMFMMVPWAEASAERIQEVLSTAPGVRPPVSPVTALPRRGHLELRGASFTYPGAERPALCDVNLAVRPGEVTALIGGTGSGKTTLANLVPRLADVTAGAVLVGGVDVRSLDPAVLARSVGYVPQRAFLFSGSVASNLRYGRPEATDAELWHALGVAQASFVAALPGGLDAPVDQGGANFSGGQRQRLAIARALVAQPHIYVFDDCFSALDYATDAALRAALAAELPDAAVLLISQRIATVADADRIVVLDHGRVVAAGPHERVLAESQTYREIAGSQLEVAA